MKPRVLFIFGAGSTAHANAPSTQQVTERIRRIESEPIRSVIKSLRAQRGEDGFDFETVLACLEELEEFSLRKEQPQAWDFVGGISSAFADFLPEFEALRGSHSPMPRLSLVNGLAKVFVDDTTNSQSDRLVRFIDQVSDAFYLTVLTLNYDDIVDRAGSWYDGFDSPDSTTGRSSGTFQPRMFVGESMNNSKTLLHLHGSVRFGFGTGLEKGQLVRYTSPTDALQSIISPPSDEDRVRPAPIISGLRKDKWMTTACVPFGHYYNAFVQTVLCCPRIVVAGYGYRDRHINSWLREHAGVHGNAQRIVQINPIFPKTAPTPQRLILGENDGYFPPSDEQVRRIIAHLES